MCKSLWHVVYSQTVQITLSPKMELPSPYVCAALRPVAATRICVNILFFISHHPIHSIPLSISKAILQRILSQCVFFSPSLLFSPHLFFLSFKFRRFFYITETDVICYWPHLRSVYRGSVEALDEILGYTVNERHLNKCPFHFRENLASQILSYGY